MPLSGIAAGFPYGHNISFIDEKNPVIVESASKTYDPKYTIKHMKSLFSLEDWQIKEYINPGIDLTLMFLFANMYDNKKAIIKAMESYGWSYAFESEEKIIGDEHWTMIHFDPIFQNSVNDEITINPILFHWTPKYYLESIKKKGLEPRSENYIFKYPPKIHLMKGNISEKDKMLLGNMLNINNKDKRNSGDYTLIDIDTNKIPYQIDYFYDPRYEFGYYTKNKICKNAFINFTNYKF